MPSDRAIVQADVGALMAMASFWNAYSARPVQLAHPCGLGLRTSADVTEERQAYVAIGSELELFAQAERSWYDLADRGSAIDEASALARLVDGEVAVLHVSPIAGAASQTWSPSDEVVRHRNVRREHRVHVRNLLLELGLQTLQSYSGPPASLMRALVQEWSTMTAIEVDLATELAQGAARQRFVDPAFSTRAPKWLEALERAIQGASISSNPLLVV